VLGVRCNERIKTSRQFYAAARRFSLADCLQLGQAIRSRAFPFLTPGARGLSTTYLVHLPLGVFTGPG